MPPLPGKRRTWLGLGVLLALYLGSYLCLSRSGFREADRYEMEGFYFCSPDKPHAETVHFSCVTVYSPLIAIDRLLGTGRAPAMCVGFTLGR
jgi:hypothetical protein